MGNRHPVVVVAAGGGGGGNRHVSFDLMNRQLLWHGFSEFVFFILPLVNIARLKNFIVRIFFSIAAPPSASSTINTTTSNTRLKRTRPHPRDNLPPACLICDSSRINRPYMTSCMHVFCYYCIQSNVMADPFYPCPCCGESVRFTGASGVCFSKQKQWQQ